MRLTSNLMQLGCVMKFRETSDKEFVIDHTVTAGTKRVCVYCSVNVECDSVALLCVCHGVAVNSVER